VYFRGFKPILHAWEKAALTLGGVREKAWEFEAMKKRHPRVLPYAALLALVAASAPLQRAQSVSAVRIMSTPDGPNFYVDNTVFYHAVSAFWPTGSTHTLLSSSGLGPSYDLAGTTQFLFTGWTSNLGAVPGNPIQVVADPHITQYTATFTIAYKFSLQVVCDPGPCTSYPGTVLVGGQNIAPLWGKDLWESPGSTITLQAYSNPGWVFAGWQPAANQNIVGLQNIVTMAAPVSLTAVFQPAKYVSVVTNPPGLQVYIDRTLALTPATLEWNPGSTHNLGGLDVQIDGQAQRWVFASWSDGGAQSHDYVASKDSNPVTITANYAAAVYPYFLTSPISLNLVVDGQVAPPPYAFIWGAGSKHRISAPLTQVDGQGVTWVFQQWDDKVTTPDRDLVIPAGGLRMFAFYAAQAKLTVSSTISGLTVAIDGTPCTTPCTVTRDPGAQVRVSAPVSLPAGDGSRQDFLGWSTGGGAPVAGDWVATLNGTSTTITAAYHLMNRLTAGANPSNGAAFSITPGSGDGFYDSQTAVNISVAPNPGYRFANWSGDLSGPVPSGTLNMNAPHQVLAQFNRVPYIAPAGVSNSAGNPPQPGVAPGSVATIFGSNLAGGTEAGPATPLPQTLAGVVVRMGDRLVPLYFASPAQINLQIPPDLAPGNQTMTVTSQGMPDVSTQFAIVRNAPGLFPLALGDKTYALVLHEDGSLVTPESPAQKGELLTAYGTGFGPTDHPRPEGVAIPPTPPYLIVDPVTVQVGDSTFAAQTAFASPGQVGVDLVQFRLDASIPSGTSPFSIAVNGASSNSIDLPIQ